MIPKCLKHEPKCISSPFANLAGYTFLPWLIALAAYLIARSAAHLSFTDYDAVAVPNWIGVENYEFMMKRDRGSSSAAGDLHLRRPRGAGQADLRARRRHAARQGHPRHRHLPALFYLPSILGGSIAVAILWRPIVRRRRACSIPSSRWSASMAPPGSPIRAIRCGRSSSSRSGSSARPC